MSHPITVHVDGVKTGQVLLPEERTPRHYTDMVCLAFCALWGGSKQASRVGGAIQIRIQIDGCQMSKCLSKSASEDRSTAGACTHGKRSGYSNFFI